VEAEDACACGLEIDPSNAALKALSAKIARHREELDSKEQARKQREDRKKAEGDVLRLALSARNIITRSTPQPPEMEDAKIALHPDPLSPTSTLTFPTMLLYPLALQSDFIKAFNETETIIQHLEYIFPLPWDRKGDYTKDSVECYMETISGGLIKAGKKLTLLKILSSGKVEVVDEVLRIMVVPKASASAWVEEFKMKKGRS
jgi:hypothetical protein